MHVITSIEYINLLQHKANLRKIAKIEAAKRKKKREARAASKVKDLRNATKKEAQKVHLRAMRHIFNEKWSTESLKKASAEFHSKICCRRVGPAYRYRGVNLGEGSKVQKNARAVAMRNLKAKQARTKGVHDNPFPTIKHPLTIYYKPSMTGNIPPINKKCVYSLVST